MDLFLKENKSSRIACEVLITTGFLQIAGEVSSETDIDQRLIESGVRDLIALIGYTNENIGFDARRAKVDIRLHTQSPDIAQGVTGKGLYKKEGAGDQGMMFGFAIDETESLMPMPIDYSHKILRKLADIRHSKKVDFLLPDAKSQVTVQYENGKPESIPTIVVSSQHRPDTNYDQIKESIIELCIKKVVPTQYLNKTEYFINPTGKFIIGGPHGDCGLTGRKIIVDTYGGFARHGGGAFSGKDPSKVDRSAAYMMRYVAKNLVASRMASVCEIQIAYAIGIAKPVSISVNTFGTGKLADHEFENMISENFDLTPKGIRETLSLRDVEYLPTATYGHFGREGPSFTWENTDKVSVFQK